MFGAQIRKIIMFGLTPKITCQFKYTYIAGSGPIVRGFLEINCNLMAFLKKSTNLIVFLKMSFKLFKAFVVFDDKKRIH